MLKECFSGATLLSSGAFGLARDEFYDISNWLSPKVISCFDFCSMLNAEYGRILLGKAVCFVLVFLVLLLLYKLWLRLYKKIKIKGKNYEISVEIGNLFDETDCQCVINFDECYTDFVGSTPDAIKASSVCGQYLNNHPELNIKNLIKQSGLKPLTGGSKFLNKVRYEPGSIIVNGDDLLMAFAKLDEDGKGHFDSRDEYLRCLDKMWYEVYKNYNHKDVCIPVLGAGLLNFKGGSGLQPSPQEFLDMIIHSYKLSCYKVKEPYKLRIICSEKDDISLESVDSNYDLF